ncbi:hypothetical protein P3W45_000818 [Vairimorpha bombi]|jgi:hypothetical protein
MVILFGILFLSPIILILYISYLFSKSRYELDTRTQNIFKRHTSLNDTDLKDMMSMIRIFNTLSDTLVHDLMSLVPLNTNNQYTGLYRGYASSLREVAENISAPDGEYEMRFIIYLTSGIGSIFLKNLDLRDICVSFIKEYPGNIKLFSKMVNIEEGECSYLELSLVSLIASINEMIYNKGL